MYSETYPDLKAKYADYKNFEVIAQTLDKHFGDIFKLDALNEVVKNPEVGEPEGSYAQLFRLCMEHLHDLYTVDEVILKLHQLLHENKKINDLILKSFIFVPPVGHHASSQIGCLEKLATDSFRMAEPLTFIDMMREVNGLIFNKKFTIGVLPDDFPDISVVHLRNLHALDIPSLKRSKKTLIVNFNRDIKAMPKWGVVDLTNPANPNVYCETALTEPERKDLERSLDVVGQCTYLGDRASGTQSTGYTAIAWLDIHKTQAWNFDLNADFSTLLRSVMIMHFGCDLENGFKYQILPHEVARFCTPSFRHIASSTFPDMRRDGIENNVFHGGRAAFMISSMAALNEIAGESLTLGDMAAVIGILVKKNWKAGDLVPTFNKAIATFPFGFDVTLARFGSPQLVTESGDGQSISLKVPDSIDLVALRSEHVRVCRERNINPLWLDDLPTKFPRKGSEKEYIAAMMVMTLIRTKAKKAVLDIHLPMHYSLNQSEIAFAVAALSENAYVTDFRINANPSLKTIDQQLKPIFARNRWLAFNGYRPPMFDNYWKQAAKHWLLYLNDKPDVLLPRRDNEFFKHCVDEMGLTGLNAVLTFLRDDIGRELIERVYRRNLPPFYAACPASEVGDYLRTLGQYLRSGAYFPFSELGLAYQAGYDHDFISILNEVNQLERFEKVTLTDCLKNKDACGQFLLALMREARDKQWVGLIVIPELEDKDNVSEELRELRVLYTQLNNVILHNLHIKAMSGLIQSIQETSDFADSDFAPALAEVAPGLPNPFAGVVAGAGAFASASATLPLGEADSSEHAATLALGSLAPTASWPLSRGGAVQLQLQQQQEITQERKLQQQQQKVRAQVLETEISGPLVNYATIDAQLGRFYDEFAQENPVYRGSACLTIPDATELQNFFHTWVNALPGVPARHIIQHMSLDAAKVLLRKHRVLASGLNPDNLPRGFYTQRSKDDELILCYSAELGESGVLNALTMNLDVRLPQAEAWEGDFRQFNLDRYMMGIIPLEDEDWQAMTLFEKMQPKKDYSADYNKFLRLNARVISAIPNFERQSAKIIKYWLIFLQVWQYQGVRGIEQFLRRSDAELSLTNGVALNALLKNQVPQLKDWATEALASWDEGSLRALGQVYYRWGDAGLNVLLAKFRQIDRTLGRPFFNDFSTTVLNASSNFNCFMSEVFFTTMDDMMERLKASTSLPTKLAWQTIVAKHFQAIAWDNIDDLWRGFDDFVKALTDMGLELEGTEFDAVPPGNMLVCMDRLLESLRNIPQPEQQKAFLAKLERLDLTQGGVHYAIQHEGFKYFDDELELHDFVGGTTYAADLERLYAWRSDEAALKMRRALASNSRFSHENYTLFSAQLANERIESRNQLMWLLHLQYPATRATEALASLARVSPVNERIIGEYLHRTVYELGYKQLTIQLDAMVALDQYLVTYPGRYAIDAMMSAYPCGTVLEALSIAWQLGRRDDADVERLFALFQVVLPKAENYPDYLQREGYKLATLFAVTDPSNVKRFFDTTANILPIVQQELRLLMTQLLSIDADNSTLAALNGDNWYGLLACIEHMKADPANTKMHRVAFIDNLYAQNLRFKYSTQGDFRALSPGDDDRPDGLNLFVDHHDRLQLFLLGHIVVPRESDAKEELLPIIRFLKVLQLNRTYLNEIEPLLATLEKTKAERYWSASYFNGLLRALQPENEKISFPITLLKTLLKESLIDAKTIDSVEKEFPPLLASTLQSILKSVQFNREEQSRLCQVALKEFSERGSNELLNRIMMRFSAPELAEGRSYALEIFAKCKTGNDVERQLENCLQLLEVRSDNAAVTANWNKTSALWLKSLSLRDNEAKLFNAAQTHKEYTLQPEKRALVLHIIAWSSLHLGLKTQATHEHELDKKAPKLVERLVKLSMDDLSLLAQTYPAQPSPTADDILRMMKDKKASPDLTWPALLDSFARRPYQEPRPDYALIATTRDADLQRMIALTQVTRGEKRETINSKQATELTFIFSYLKRLESGEATVRAASRPIAQMNQAELAEAFKTLSAESAVHPNDHALRAEIWAVLFEALGRTTRKYPHLAQQFALIANDICIDAPSQVLQLATGEGKSHYVALRAARHAGLGKTVDVCTAKRTLAERDREDYDPFFTYLGLKSAYIHAKSSRAEYTDSQIHYSTMGDLSLFLDDQSYLGQAIEIPRDMRVALFDEFDFIRDDEGRKTQYNYARPTGRTPKQMTWFYKCVNAFYTDAVSRGLFGDKQHITKDILHDFIQALQRAANENEDRQSLVTSLLREPLQLVQWLQSAYEADKLQWGVGFTVRQENIEVGEETYPMREIIPLSSDNQKMFGSTFSNGVHELLAVRLNEEAKREGQPQDFHIHLQSHIISSQVAAQRMDELYAHWEGFSGTISAAQAASLYEDQRTQVLHVPTNQRDLRNWHAPNFYRAPEDSPRTAELLRLEAIAEQMTRCLENKQSVLFSCNNDRAVKKLQQDLLILKQQRKLSEEVYNSIIFYTNEDERSANAVLKDKEAAENWQGSKKQKGIILAASGFGRGDNVGVEAVFLMDVNDNNDKLQKGGRTARNGETGEVFQFYLAKDLEEEEEYLMAVLEAMPDDVDMGEVRDALAEITDEDEDQRCFERVLLLREFEFNLKNAANQGYHIAKAQYSSWGMKRLSLVMDPAVRQSLMLSFSKGLARLEKEWIGILSRKCSVIDKITAIERAIADESQEFTTQYAEDTGSNRDIVPAFELRTKQPETFKLVVTKKPAPTPKDQVVAAICSRLSQLPDVHLHRRRAEIPDLIAKLDDGVDEMRSLHALQKFAKKIARCSSSDQFIDTLDIEVDQFLHPSARLDEVRAPVYAGVEFSNLYTRVPDSLLIDFDKKMDDLTPALQTTMLETLCAPSLRSPQQRLECALPLLDHLNRFIKGQQDEWGKEYIERMDQLLDETPADLLEVRLSHSKPMSWSRFDALWQMPKRYSSPENAGETLKLLGDVIEPSPEHRMRMLSKWESWVADLDKAQAHSFLMDFLRLMQGFREGRDWDGFVSLVTKTQDWWNKAEKTYQADLLALWQQLSAVTAEVTPEQRIQLNDFIKWSSALSGKDWFQVLARGVTLPTELLCKHLAQVKALWLVVDQYDMKKTMKMQRFSDCLSSLAMFYESIKSLDSALQASSVEQLLLLSAQDFSHLMELLHENTTLLGEHPETIVAMLDFLSQEDITLDCKRMLCEALLHFARYCEMHADDDPFAGLLAGLDRLKQNPEGLAILLAFYSQNESALLKVQPEVIVAMLDFLSKSGVTPACKNMLCNALLHLSHYCETHKDASFARLLAGLDRLKRDPEGLTILLSLYAKDDNHIEEPLFDGAISHIKQQAAEARPQIEDCVEHFYRVKRECKAVPRDIMAQPEIADLFAFENTQIDTNHQRLMHMHLLRQGVFISAAVGENAWSHQKNDELFRLGLERYSQHTQTVLAKPKEKDASTSYGRDLSVEQQHSLLHLTDELTLIGQPRRSTGQFAEPLVTELISLVQNYQGSWFKSKQRKEQINDLQQALNWLSQDRSADRYRNLLRAIHDVKLHVVKSDMQINLQRLFKNMNSGGESRLLNTLNKMHDLVLSHWTKDRDVIHSMQVYQDAHHQEFRDLMASLSVVIDAQYEKEEAVDEYLENHRALKSLYGFFNPAHKKQHLHVLSLKTFLESVVSKPTFTEADIQGITTRLKEASAKKLPGHLLTVVNQVLGRAEALAIHLHEHDDFITRGNAYLHGR
jgi:hypothetical protein